MEFKAGDWVGIGEDEDNIDRMRQIRDALTQIVSSPGKIYLDKVLRNRYHGIMAGIASAPLPSLDAALTQEYQKGQAFECLYQESLCENLIEHFSEAIRDYMENSEIEGEFNG